jgi:hypothetical protein
MGAIMGKNGPGDTKQEHGREEQSSHGEQSENGHSGEGAASALAQLISQGERHRRHSMDGEDAFGSGHR